MKFRMQKSSKKSQSKSQKTNWRFIFLLILIFSLLLSLFSSEGSRKKNLTFEEFEKAFSEGRIAQGISQLPLKIVAKESSTDLIIEGYISEESFYNFSKEEFFSVDLHLPQQVNQIQNLLGDRLKFQKGKKASSNRSASLPQIKEWISHGEVILNSSEKFPILRIAPDGSATLSFYRKLRTTPKETDSKNPLISKFQVRMNALLMQNKLNMLLLSRIPYERQEKHWSGILINLLPVVLLIGFFVFIARQQMKVATRGTSGFGKSKMRATGKDEKENKKITFKDVAGVDEAKEELLEVVDFLKNPKKFEKLGAIIPKGVLLIGAPGTGKTLLARAVSGEADVEFFSISGSDFVEMFVGIGASRVRDIFQEAKRNSPCIVFIDEIDAVGRHRGHGVGGGHDEREQTLNALLVEMDGFENKQGIVVIAATNRADVLDPALLRPGRFDRNVIVPLPDMKGREEILNVHTKKVCLSENVDLSIIARGTPGFSGAELANLINEAALLAAAKNLEEVTIKEMEEARDKVRWGKERRSLAITQKERKNTAYHEAGHAIVSFFTEATDPIHKVTIIPRGQSLGATMFLPSEDKFSYRKKELIAQLAVAMGGRAAEEIIFGDVTNGAVQDIRQATQIARKMVCEWGMSESMGMIEYGENRDEVFLARDIARAKTYSEDTAQKIDSEMKTLIDSAYEKAKCILLEKRKELNSLSEALLEYETLDFKHVKEILEEGELKNPPFVSDSSIQKIQKIQNLKKRKKKSS